MGTSSKSSPLSFRRSGLTEAAIRPLQTGFNGQKTIGTSAVTILGGISSGTVTIQNMSDAANKVVYVGFGTVTTTGATVWIRLLRNQSMNIDIDDSKAELFVIGSVASCDICWIGGAP